MIQPNSGALEGIEILKEEIRHGHWKGTDPIPCGPDYAMSINKYGKIAIATYGTYGGWMILTPDEVKTLYEATVNRPTPKEVDAYSKEINAGVDGAAFCDHHDAIGWVSGKWQHPIRDWKAVVRNWKRNREAKTSDLSPQQQMRRRQQELWVEYVMEYVARIKAFRSWHDNAKACPMGDPVVGERDLWIKIEREHGNSMVIQVRKGLTQCATRK